ncbi:MAG: hypothetical protein C4589_02775 [Peptococcaceae bacterium]|nr:MAG: hypothetical protein C4589_02775 [Peptococcaceae bacterium]
MTAKTMLKASSAESSVNPVCFAPNPANQSGPLYVVCSATCPLANKSSGGSNMPFILFLILILLLLGTSKEKIIAIIEKIWPDKK